MEGVMVGSLNVADQFGRRVGMIVGVRRERTPIEPAKANSVSTVVGRMIDQAESDLGISDLKPGPADEFEPLKNPAAHPERGD
jgi:hypothetical protein